MNAQPKEILALSKQTQEWIAPRDPIVIGKDVLELLSSSMYVDPMTIYREYVQNAADAIDLGRVEDGRVDIQIDPNERRIRIRDNGAGVPSEQFASRLINLGASAKRGTSARGFRGVGRLAGLGYCQELPHRVDFRSLVRDLGATLHCRVELRQLSARDSARVQGGIGSCGRDLCCATFLTDFEPVTIRMAKDQDLPLNPLRISGACGRFMCCLKYEHPLYQQFQAVAPTVGTRVSTPEGDGRVVGPSVPRDAVIVRMDADGSRCACSRASVCGPRKAHDEKYS
jgi:hypothetical protein